MRTRKVVIAILSFALLAFALSACGDDDAEDTGATATSGATAPVEKGEIINVELGEDGADFFVKSESASADAGTVTFAVTNVGKLYHEFIVYANKEGVAATDLPVEDGIAVLNEDDIIGEAEYATPPIVPEDKKPGDADHRIRSEGWGAELTVDLEPGKYILLCNLDGHYQTGQATDFEVK